MEPWAIAIMSFLGGAVLTAFGYTFVFSNKLTELKTIVANLVDTMKKPITVPEPVIKQLTEVCATTKDLEKRVDRLEGVKI